MSRPWMPLWVGDYLRDTKHLTTVEHGAYMLLIMHYWTYGGLPTDEKNLQKISQISPHLWAKISPNIHKFFTPDWRHKRIDKELEKHMKISRARAAAALIKHTKNGAFAGRTNMQLQRRNSANGGKPERKKEIAPYHDPPKVSASLEKLLSTIGKH